MSLQLLDIKKQHHRALSTGSPISSPTQSPNMFNQSLVLPFQRNSKSPEGIFFCLFLFRSSQFARNCILTELIEIYTVFLISENGSSYVRASTITTTTTSVYVGQQSLNGYIGKEVVVNGENGNSESNGNGKQSSSQDEELDLQEWYKTCFFIYIK